jgi:redox-sensitive bicupin YhaK (pirin superfamily)
MTTFPTHEPACSEPDPAKPSEHAVDLVIEGRQRGVGSFTVSRLLPAPRRRMVGPFVFLDHMGPIELPPGAGFDVPPHPHIGLSTVTYGLAGENVHRDSLGTVQINRPGDVNMMTAGRGIVHSERAEPAFRAAGGLLHGLQIWLGLPAEHEDDPPSFEHHPQATLPVIAPADGVHGRVLMGTAFGATSPIHHPGRPWLIDLELAAGAQLDVPADQPERAIFVVAGEVQLGREALTVDRLAVLCTGVVARITATAPSRLVLLGGPPLGPCLMYWNFVASTQDRIDRAARAWRERAFPAIPTDDREFVPLPEHG